MLDQAVLRLLDSLFRHKFLAVLPFVLFGVLGVLYVNSQDPEYKTHGVILVEDRTLLSSITGVRGAEGGYQTPATYTSRQLNAILQTDAFVAAIAERSGLGEAATLEPDDYRMVRSSIGSWEAGENLVHVWSAHEDPELAQRFAEATIDSLIQWQIDAEVGQSTAAQGFLEPLTEQYRADLAAARDALEEYLQANPAPKDGDRPVSEQLVIDGLTAEVSDAKNRYTDALPKEEAARLATAQAESDVRNRLQLIDAPETPVEPESRLKTSVMVLAVFLATGAMLSAAAVVGGALVDQTLRFPAEIKRRLNVDVLAVLPEAGHKGAGR